jgi:hypothetical protein
MTFLASWRIDPKNRITSGLFYQGMRGDGWFARDHLGAGALAFPGRAACGIAVLAGKTAGSCLRVGVARQPAARIAKTGLQALGGRRHPRLGGAGEPTGRIAELSGLAVRSAPALRAARQSAAGIAKLCGGAAAKWRTGHGRADQATAGIANGAGNAAISQRSAFDGLEDSATAITYRLPGVLGKRNRTQRECGEKKGGPVFHVALGRRQGNVYSEKRRKCLMREAGGSWNLVKRAEIQWMPDSDDGA